jgi:hypothetical protein
MKTRATVWALLLFAPGLSFGKTGVAKYAGEFLAFGVGGRSLGMGGASVALASDVTAGYWNPAGLALLRYPQFALMHDEQFGSLVNHDYLAAAMPLGLRSSLGISLIRVGVDDIPDTRNAGVDVNGNLTYDPNAFSRVDPNRVRFFNSADWALYLSYARRASEEFSYGASAKFLRRDVGDNAATGVGFDLGAWYRPLEQVQFGAAIQDVTTTFLAWDTGTNELISPTVKLGAAGFLDALGGRFIPAVDLDVRFENRRTASTFNYGRISGDVHAGLEYSFQDLVAVRAGYSDIKQLTLGAGLRLSKLVIDYSFAKFDATEQLGNSHRVSIIFTLEGEQFQRMPE